jgi:hypothetical protein
MTYLLTLPRSFGVCNSGFLHIFDKVNDRTQSTMRAYLKVLKDNTKRRRQTLQAKWDSNPCAERLRQLHIALKYLVAGSCFYEV